MHKKSKKGKNRIIYVCRCNNCMPVIAREPTEINPKQLVIF